MPVTGSKELAAALRRIPERAKAEVAQALRQGAEAVLEDMRRRTPVDPASKTHARDGLTILTENDGQTVRVGLPTEDLAQKYFWFRFLDGGTKGGEVLYWRRGGYWDWKEGRTSNDLSVRRTASSKQSRAAAMHTMTVPSRPALRIREQALDGHRDEIERLVGEAIRRAIES